MADDEDTSQLEIYSTYAVHYYRKPGKRRAAVHREIVHTGTVQIDRKKRRLTAHFKATPTGNWGWDMFGVPYGEPVPELPPLEEQPERPAKNAQPTGDDEEPHGLFTGSDDEAA